MGCLEQGEDHQAGLVVMASQGRSGPGSLLPGSVAKHLLHRLEVPIVLVRHSSTREGRHLPRLKSKTGSSEADQADRS